MIIFALILGLIGVYISSAFVRLEVFASISVIVLSSIGLAALTSELFHTSKLSKKKPIKSIRTITKVSYVVIILVLFILPTSLPANANWITAVKVPPTILNGGTAYTIATDDWLESLEWVKNNTPPDAVIAAWWDYGYWIQTLGERKSLADNSTIFTSRIQNIAKMFLSEPDRAWEILRELDADYVLIFISSQKIQNDPQDYYVLTGGGDESKKQWFMRIAGEPTSKFLYNDGFSGTPEFWESTLFAKMIPFSVVGYLQPGTSLVTESYQSGYTGIYIKDIKYPSDGNGPLRLAYSSTSFEDENIGPILGIFIYEINKDYNPSLKP